MEIVKLAVKKNGILVSVEKTEKLVGLERMRNLLDVNFIDIVTVKFPILKSMDIVVDDEGALKECRQINLVASALAGQPIFVDALVVKRVETSDGIYEGGLEGAEVKEIYKAIDIVYQLYINFKKKEKMK